MIKKITLSFTIFLAMFLSLGSVFALTSVTVDSPIDLTEYAFNQETFNILVTTNETAICDYTYNTVATEFTSTNATSHSSLFTMGENLDFTQKQFDIQVTCNAVATSFSVFQNPPSASERTNKGITDTTGQLPQVGNDLSGFLTGLAPGVIGFVFVLAIIGGIIGIFGGIVFVIRKSVNGGKK